VVQSRGDRRYRLNSDEIPVVLELVRFKLLELVEAKEDLETAKKPWDTYPAPGRRLPTPGSPSSAPPSAWEAYNRGTHPPPASTHAPDGPPSARSYGKRIRRSEVWATSLSSAGHLTLSYPSSIVFSQSTPYSRLPVRLTPTQYEVHDPRHLMGNGHHGAPSASPPRKPLARADQAEHPPRRFLKKQVILRS
jgi:hypothetical protein